jgi:hypothetical protein
VLEFLHAGDVLIQRPKGACSLVPMAAARRSTGGPVPRKGEPVATTSGKRRSVGRVPLPCSRPQQITVPANPCAPHARPGPFFSKANAARAERDAAIAERDQALSQNDRLYVNCNPRPR